jgi:uncharacterized protein (TIGR00369 family)
MALTNEQLRDRMNTHMPPTGILLGQEILELDRAAGFAKIKFYAKPEFCNPMGGVQGGIIAAMLDDAAAIACIIKSDERIVLPTLEFKVSFYAPAQQGTLIAHGYCRKLGRKVAFLEAELFDEAGKKLAAMSATAIPTPMTDNPNFVSRIK